MKPLPPCDREDYRGRPPYPKCGKPANAWLSQRYPGNLCHTHLLEQTDLNRRWPHGNVWLLTLTLRELVYKAQFVELEPGETCGEQVCPICHGRGMVRIE